MIAFTHKWFPGQRATTQRMKEAVFLEKDYWKKMEIAMANGIGKGF